MKATQIKFELKTLCLIAAVFTTLMIAQIAPAAIVNGDFETGVAYPGGRNIFSSGAPVPWSAPPLQSPDCYDNASAGITDGWPLTGIPAYNNMFQNMLAASGKRFMGFAAGLFGGGSFSESILQTTAPLTGGQTYTISASLAAEDTGKAQFFGGPYTGRGKVDVYLNNTLIGSLAPNTASLTWQQRSFSFVAPNAATAVFEFRAAFANASAPVSSYIGIDNISLVPEPGACLLTTVGWALCSLRRRRSA